MDVVVTRTPEGWVAHHRESVVGKAAALLRPDGRCWVTFGACHPNEYRPLVQAIARQLRRDLYTAIGDADTQARQHLLDTGFVANRREHTYAIPTDPTRTGLTNLAVPAGFQLRTADRVSEDRLRALDEELKQDVPGADGWQWDRQGFRNETYDAPDFDPATYLVAIDQATDRYAGLIRVWNRPSGPRLGLIGVAAGYRGRGLARVLLAQVLATLRQRGDAEVVAEVDVTNTSSNRLLTSLGAHRTGGTIELIRPWPTASPLDAMTGAGLRSRA